MHVISFAAEKARRASLNVITVRVAPAADGVSKVPEKAPETLDFLRGRRSYERASRDMFPEFVQRHVEVSAVAQSSRSTTSSA